MTATPTRPSAAARARSPAGPKRLYASIDAGRRDRRRGGCCSAWSSRATAPRTPAPAAAQRAARPGAAGGRRPFEAAPAAGRRPRPGDPRADGRGGARVAAAVVAPACAPWFVEDRDGIRQVHHVGLAAGLGAAGRPESELYGAPGSTGRSKCCERRRPAQRPGTRVRGGRQHGRHAPRARGPGHAVRARRRLRRGVVATSAALVVALIAGAVDRSPSAQGQAEPTGRGGRGVARAGVAVAEPHRVRSATWRCCSRSKPTGGTASEATTGRSRRRPSCPTSRSCATSTPGPARRAHGVQPRRPHAAARLAHAGAPPPSASTSTRARRPRSPSTSSATASWGGPCPSTSRDHPLPRRGRRRRAGRSRRRPGARPGGVGGGDRRPRSSAPTAGSVAVTTWGSTDGPGRVVILDTGSLDVVASVAEPGPPGGTISTRCRPGSTTDRLAVGSPSGRLLLWSPTAARSRGGLNDPPRARPTGCSRSGRSPVARRSS